MHAGCKTPVTSVGFAWATCCSGSGLRQAGVHQAPTVTPRYLDDEAGRDRYHRAELAFRQRSIAGYEAAMKIYESLLDDGVHGAEVHAGLARCCVALAGMIAMPVRVAMPLRPRACRTGAGAGCRLRGCALRGGAGSKFA